MHNRILTFILYFRDYREQISSFDANVHTLQTELGNLTHALHKERETYIANLERLKTSALKEQGQLQNVIKGLEEDNSDLIRQCDSLKAVRIFLILLLIFKTCTSANFF